MRWLLFCGVLPVLAACADLGGWPPGTPPVMAWADVAARPLPPPGERVAYGADPLQFGELRLPDGDGAHPVVVLVHGGCWLHAFDYRHATHAAAALAKLGYATWSIEYRRVGDAGGGWPKTFLDVAAGVNHLRSLATSHPLDLSRVVLMGHSAGGQLVLWLASRGGANAGGDLHVEHPLPVTGIVALAPITDLARYRHGEPGSCNAAVEPLMGGTEEDHPGRYAEVSPILRLPLGVPTRIIQGTLDIVVPPDPVREYVSVARAAGDRIDLTEVSEAGHFEMVVPEGPAWRAIVQAIDTLAPGATTSDEIPPIP